MKVLSWLAGDLQDRHDTHGLGAFMRLARTCASTLAYRTQQCPSPLRQHVSASGLPRTPFHMALRTSASSKQRFSTPVSQVVDLTGWRGLRAEMASNHAGSPLFQGGLVEKSPLLQNTTVE